MRATTRCRPWWPGELARAPPRRPSLSSPAWRGWCSWSSTGFDWSDPGVGLLPRGAPPRGNPWVVVLPGYCRAARRSRCCSCRGGRPAAVALAYSRSSRSVRRPRWPLPAHNRLSARPDARDLAALLRAPTRPDAGVDRVDGTGGRAAAGVARRSSALARRASTGLRSRTGVPSTALRLDQDLRVVEREDPGAVQPIGLGRWGERWRTRPAPADQGRAESVVSVVAAGPVQPGQHQDIRPDGKAVERGAQRRVDDDPRRRRRPRRLGGASGVDQRGSDVADQAHCEHAAMLVVAK